MEIFTTITDYKKARYKAKGSVGCVPTMGYLHEGHLSLARRAKAENGHVVTTIFVNPTQFGPQEDLSRYPRDPERDIALLEKEGVDWLFMPSSPDGIFPSGFDTWIEMGGVTEVLEGAHRPGHFRGVATVVAKLFNIIEPHKAYFGQKDAQQVVVIKKLVRDLNFPMEIIVCPTVREHDGLAMSSRNVYLGPEERKAALVLWKSLQLAQRIFSGGTRDAQHVRSAMRSRIESEPLANIDYVSIAHPDTLKELEQVDGPALISLAVRIGATRLIDNIIIR